MEWTTELQPVPVAEVYDAIDELKTGDLTTEAEGQLIAAKDGAKATIAELSIPDGMLVGVEFAGNTGTDPLPVVTTRIRQVEAPPEPEPAEAEEESPAPA